MSDKAINNPLICIYNTSANIGFSDLVQTNRIDFDMIYYLFLRDVWLKEFSYTPNKSAGQLWKSIEIESTMVLALE